MVVQETLTNRLKQLIYVIKSQQYEYVVRKYVRQGRKSKEIEETSNKQVFFIFMSVGMDLYFC